jgi:hypothetical protein
MKEVEVKYPHFRVAVDQFLNAPSTKATQEIQDYNRRIGR